MTWDTMSVMSVLHCQVTNNDQEIYSDVEKIYLPNCVAHVTNVKRIYYVN